MLNLALPCCHAILLEAGACQSTICHDTQVQLPFLAGSFVGGDKNICVPLHTQSISCLPIRLFCNEQASCDEFSATGMPSETIALSEKNRGMMLNWKESASWWLCATPAIEIASRCYSLPDWQFGCLTGSMRSLIWATCASGSCSWPSEALSLQQVHCSQLRAQYLHCVAAYIRELNEKRLHESASCDSSNPHSMTHHQSRHPL